MLSGDRNAGEVALEAHSCGLRNRWRNALHSVAFDNQESASDARPVARRPYLSKEPIMRTVHRDVRADDYIRRLDRLTLVTGAITVTIAASLFV